MRHPFKPKSDDPCRCAYCLRMLDCAPHLPLTPRATYPGQSLEYHTGTSTGSRRRVTYPWLAGYLSLAAVQGER